MKPCTQAFLDLIAGQQTQWAMAELYTFASVGDRFESYYTDVDVPIVNGGKTFRANALRIEGLRYKIGIGLQVDEQTIKVTAYPGETLFGDDFISSVEGGILDGGTVKRQRGFWASTGLAVNDFSNPAITVVDLFVGRVASIDKIGRTTVEMKLKSPLSYLDVDMPRNSYGGGCKWTLYDAGCTLSRAAFTSSFVVQSATATTITPVGTLSPVTGADGVSYFLQGRLFMESGENSGQQFLVRDNDASRFYLQYPFLVVPAPGDVFQVSAGCTKGESTCLLKFNNRINFGGYDHVPPVVASL